MSAASRDGAAEGGSSLPARAAQRLATGFANPESRVLSARRV